MVGAVEAQKAEGVLHMHAFLYIQMASQLSTLYELGQKLKEGLITAQAMKAYIDYPRCAAYPSKEQFDEERADVEKKLADVRRRQDAEPLTCRSLGHRELARRQVEDTV